MNILLLYSVVNIWWWSLPESIIIVGTETQWFPNYITFSAFIRWKIEPFFFFLSSSSEWLWTHGLFFFFPKTSMDFNPLLSFSFWCSNYSKVGQWELLQARSCVLWHDLINLCYFLSFWHTKISPGSLAFALYQIRSPFFFIFSKKWYLEIKIWVQGAHCYSGVVGVVAKGPLFDMVRGKCVCVCV